MPSSGGPSPFGWTTSSPSSPEHSLSQAWHLGQGGGACHVRGVVGQGGAGDQAPLRRVRPWRSRAARVERRGARVQPGVVLGGAEVAQLDSVPVLGRDVCHGRFAACAGGVGGLELGSAGRGASGAQQAIVLVDGHRAPNLGGGAFDPIGDRR